MADCASVEDVRTAVEAGADGVGLLLSEYLLLAGRVNGEEEQYGFYAACLAAAQGRPVTICTLDGAPDKTGTEFPREEEANPAMGLCGVRYCLAHPDFFETQLRALLRAGLAGNLRILLPMVSTRDEFEHALDAIYRAKCALRAVSYTHLDVYKRQGKSRLIKLIRSDGGDENDSDFTR